MSVQTITPERLSELKAAGESVELIDVRTPAEFREIHVGFARNVPLDRLDASGFAKGGRPVYVMCRSGNRGKEACEKLFNDAGVDVVNVEGGVLAWEEAGLPVVRGKKTIALDRQVRIAAGSFVILGSVLAVLVSPYWIALPAFVGAGLVFAGVTDTCGMAMLLARMPWNQVKENPGGEACGKNPSALS
ncbi:MAG: rhodanese-like domain-containing protein [Candidatus Dadabacteria bacterium]|nr:rhodanese-like domain-containing protein [Candidatus Dadabacteria bacterium]